MLYRSAEIISGCSDVLVTRSRSCFVVGEISRVTVWFVSGGHISSVPAVVNATNGMRFSMHSRGNVFVKWALCSSGNSTYNTVAHA